MSGDTLAALRSCRRSDGRLKALAVTSSAPGAARDSHAGRGWRAGNRGLGLIGFVISSKVPADIQKKLSDALIRATIRRSRKRLQAQFMDPVTRPRSSAPMDDELQRWSPIKKLGIKGQRARRQGDGCTSPNPPARPAARRIRCRRWAAARPAWPPPAPRATAPACCWSSAMASWAAWARRPACRTSAACTPTCTARSGRWCTA